MATLTVADVTLAGVAVGLVAANAGGDVFANDGNVFFLIKTSGTGTTVTFTTTGKVKGVSLTSPQVVVASAAEMLIGPFPTDLFNNSSGQVAVSYSAATGVTVSPLRMSR